MNKIFYVYWDYDDESDKDLDICGEAYLKLIDTCFQYASVFGVTYSMKAFNSEQSLKGSVFRYCIAEKQIEENQVRCFFMCCQETERYLLESYHCLFGWYWNEKEHGHLPENLAFYRRDGSSLFASETHEGQCFLYPRNDEDFSFVLKSEGWNLGTEGGCCMPYYMKSSWLNPQPNNLPEST